MYQVLLILFLLVAIILVTLIMLQDGKLTDMKSGSSTEYSTSFFSSFGYGNYITFVTTVLAFLFFIFSLILGNITNKFSISPINNYVFNEHDDSSTNIIYEDKDKLQD